MSIAPSPSPTDGSAWKGCIFGTAATPPPLPSPKPHLGCRWHSRPQDADVSSFLDSLASFPVWSFGFLNHLFLTKSPHLPSISTARDQPVASPCHWNGRSAGLCRRPIWPSLVGPQSDIDSVVIDGPFCFCFCPVCPAQTARHPPPIFSPQDQNVYSLSDSMCVPPRPSFPGRNQADDGSLRPRLERMCMARTVVP